jgi:hypothetical protein
MRNARPALSSPPLALAALLALTALLAGACGRHAVRASEKKFLADQIMIFDDDPHEASADEHLRTNREGAAGGKGAGGGGCGCN